MSPFTSAELSSPRSDYSISFDTVALYPRNPIVDGLYCLYLSSPNGVARSFRQEMFNDICAFRKLEDGWLGPGSHGIPRETADNVVNVTHILSGVEGLPNPELTPTQNGTISFEWESGRGEVYVEFGKTRISGFVRVDDLPTQYFADMNSLQPSFYTEVRDMLYPSAKTYSITTVGAAFDGNSLA